MTRRAAQNAFKQASLSPKDIQVIELHDCFMTNEMCATEDLGLAPHGEGWKLVADGCITYDQSSKTKRTSPGWIINPSGGLIFKGHLLGATGLAQTAELDSIPPLEIWDYANVDLVWHLRGWSSNHCVPQTEYCLQHNMGLGGATVVTVLGRADDKVAPLPSEIQDQVDGRRRLGYHPALEARGLNKQDMEAVRSQKAFSNWAADIFEALGNPREVIL